MKHGELGTKSVKKEWDKKRIHMSDNKNYKAGGQTLECKVIMDK